MKTIKDEWSCFLSETDNWFIGDFSEAIIETLVRSFVAY